MRLELQWLIREFKKPGRDAGRNFDMIKIKMNLYFTYESRDTLKSFSFDS